MNYDVCGLNMSLFCIAFLNKKQDIAYKSPNIQKIRQK